MSTLDLGSGAICVPHLVEKLRTPSTLPPEPCTGRGRRTLSLRRSSSSFSSCEVSPRSSPPPARHRLLPSTPIRERFNPDRRSQHGAESPCTPLPSSETLPKAQRATIDHHCEPCPTSPKNSRVRWCNCALLAQVEALEERCMALEYLYGRLHNSLQALSTKDSLPEERSSCQTSSASPSERTKSCPDRRSIASNTEDDNASQLTYATDSVVHVYEDLPRGTWRHPHSFDWRRLSTFRWSKPNLKLSKQQQNLALKRRRKRESSVWCF